MTLLLVNILSVNNFQLEMLIEHSPIDQDPDYVHFLLGRDDSSEVIIYRLPMKLRHREAFVVRMCKKDTIEAFKASKDLSTLDENCVDDSYNSVAIIDYLNKMNHQNPANNVYKICNYGFAYQEAERSYIQSNVKSLEENIHHEKEKGLFYVEPKQFYLLVEETQHFNYRKEFLDKNEFKCVMKFRTTQK